MEDFKLMNDEEKTLVNKAADIINNKIYFAEKKLKNINLDDKVKNAVKDYVRLCNEHYKMDCYTNEMVYYANLIKKYPKASECIKYCDKDPEVKDILSKIVKAFAN